MRQHKSVKLSRPPSSSISALRSIESHVVYLSECLCLRVGRPYLPRLGLPASLSVYGCVRLSVSLSVSPSRSLSLSVSVSLSLSLCISFRLGRFAHALTESNCCAITMFSHLFTVDLIPARTRIDRPCSDAFRLFGRPVHACMPRSHSPLPAGSGKAATLCLQ